MTVKSAFYCVTKVTKSMVAGALAMVLAFTPLLVGSKAYAINPEFTASEIFDAAALPVLGVPLATSPLIDSTNMVVAGLPTEAILNVVAIGFVQSVDTVQGRYQIEGRQFYASADSKIYAGITVGTYVRVVAMRTIATGALVIDALTIRTLPSTGSRSLLSYDYVTPGVVENVTPHIWTISGVDYVIDNATTPADIDPNVTVGSSVGVQFMTNEQASIADAPVSVTGLTGVEIFPAVELGPLGTAINANAKFDTEPMGVNGIAPNTHVSVVISGFVQAVNAAKNEYKIADRYVYTATDTKIKGNVSVGKYVKMVTSRKIEDSPLVAEVMTQRTPPKGASTPRIDTFYITSGLVQEMTASYWMVDGLHYVINDPTFPAEITAEGSIGEDVGIQFLTGQTPYRVLASNTGTGSGPVVPPVVVPPVVTATFNAAEIFPDAGVPVVPAPKYPFATTDTTNYTDPNLPSDAVVSLSIDGSIDSIDTAKGEYKIGGKKVYLSNQTVVKGLITTNSQVRIVALRTVANGPLVAEKIVAKNIIGKVKTPATTVFYLTRGQVQAIAPTVWTVGGYNYIINNPTLPADISVPATTGQFVGIQFTL